MSLFYFLNHSQKKLDSFKSIIDHAPDSILRFNASLYCDFANAKFYQEFGENYTNIVGQALEKTGFPDNITERLEDALQHCISNQTRVRIEFILPTPEGMQCYENYMIPEIFNNGRVKSVLCFLRNFTRRKEAEERMEYLNFHDELTGLYNRRYFQNEMERLNHSRKIPISIIITDIDNLKKINDMYGHGKGDYIIQQAADILSSVIRKEDIVARIGGDEFVVLLPVTRAETAKNIIKRINNRCKERSQNADVEIGLSIGSATCEKKEEDLHNVLNQADKDMYKKRAASRAALD